MKHCIIAKFGDMVTDKKETLAQVKALFAAAAPVEGVTGIVIHENCVAWTYAKCRRLSANAADGDGCIAGENHLNENRVYHISTGGLCAGGRFD